MILKTLPFAMVIESDALLTYRMARDEHSDQKKKLTSH